MALFKGCPTYSSKIKKSDASFSGYEIYLSKILNAALEMHIWNLYGKAELSEKIST